MADGILLLTNMHPTGSMKHGWVVILGSSVLTGNESGANVRKVMIQRRCLSLMWSMVESFENSVPYAYLVHPYFNIIRY